MVAAFDVSALADALPEPMMLASSDGEIRVVNRSLAKIFGCTREDIVGRSLTELVSSPVDSVHEFLRRCSRSSEPVPTALRLAREGGGVDYRVEGARVAVNENAPDQILLRFKPKQASSERFVALNEKIEALNDQIARRRVIERLLREQKEWLHGTLSSIGEGLIATGADGRVRLMNEEAERLTGWSAESACGMILHDVFQPIDEATGNPGSSSVSKALANGRTVKRQGRVLTARDGTSRPIQETAAPIRDEDGNAVGAVLVFRDVTKERRTAEDVRRAKEAAEAANRAKSEFLASVSRELRTPMNVVIGMTDLALETELDSQVRDYLSTARESASNLLHLLDDLLDLSKIEAREIVIDERLFRVRDVVYEATRVMAVQAAEKSLELTCQVGPEVPDVVRGDSARLRQILLNVIGNAIKFTSHGEVSLEVSVSERESGDEGRAVIHFAVRDTGVGISDSDRAKIFSPFVQADSSSSRVFGGTGLGLSIVSELVDRMGGKLWVESELRRGSTFHFALSYPVEAEFELEDEVRGLPDALHGAPVLVVDDHPSSLEVLSSLLARWGMTVNAASGADEAIALLAAAKRRGCPHKLVLVDASMPGRDAHEVIEQLDTGDTRAILMASPAEREDRENNFDSLDASAGVSKPVRPSDLMATMRTAFGSDVNARREPDGDQDRVPHRTSLRVLLAEDTPANQKLVTALLRRAGHRVELASDGLEAVALNEHGDFDAILMDVQMPRVDGFEATRRIRAAEADAGIRTPIIALSAHAMTGFREQCLVAGMDDYMAKPFTGAELDERLMAITSNGRRRSNDARSCASAEIPRGSTPEKIDLSDELIARFLGDFDALLARSRAAVESSDPVELEQAAHSLRGSSAFVQAEGVTAAAAKLEEIGKSRSLDGAAEAVETLSHELAALRRSAGQKYGD